MCTVRQEKGLLDTPGWKQSRGLANREKLIIWTIKQANMISYQLSPKFQFGYQVPKDYDEALDFDTDNGDNRWIEYILLEMDMMDEYDVFIDK